MAAQSCRGVGTRTWIPETFDTIDAQIVNIQPSRVSISSYHGNPSVVRGSLRSVHRERGSRRTCIYARWMYVCMHVPSNNGSENIDRVQSQSPLDVYIRETRLRKRDGKTRPAQQTACPTTEA